MKKIEITTVVAALLLMVASPLFACTSAIFTGKVTPDGRPLLWKHRDTGELNNRISFIKGEKYDFIALLNSPNGEDLKEAWSGTNSVGFSIMNTASYNLKDDNVPDSQMDHEGNVMWKALATCKTLRDFEKMLDKLPRPIGVEANFGVIDAEGGAAYYEVNNTKWTKIDVNDPKIAPMGYLTYTNHSYTGRLNEGSGYERYTNADNIIKTAVACAVKITPEWIYNNLSRSYNNEVLGIDLVKENSIKGEGVLQRGTGFFVDQDFIPRKSTSAIIVVKGVKVGENPLNTVMWTMLGYPATAVAVPLFVKAGENQPPYMVSRKNVNMKEDYSEDGVAKKVIMSALDDAMASGGLKIKENNAVACDLALYLKEDIFSIKRGNGKNYFNFNNVYNPYGTGYMQLLAPLNHLVFVQGEAFVENVRDKEYNEELFKAFYKAIGKEIIINYSNLL